MPTKLTRAQHIAQVMASMGFRPSNVVDPNHVEYIKDYAEANGRLARLSVLFSKTSFMHAMDQARLMQFVVTVQGSIDPMIESVETLAPKALRPDMLQMLHELEGLARPAEPMETATCDLCGAELSEWTVTDTGGISCTLPEVCPERVGVTND